MSYIKKYLDWISESYSAEHNEYAGEHTAPNKGDSAPLYNLTGIYPADIYEYDALRMYGSGEGSWDIESLGIIKDVRNKPNALVKIYRAIPDLNKEVKKKISDLYDLIIYKQKFGFFPIRSKSTLMGDIDDMFDREEVSYNENQIRITEYIKNQIDELSKLLLDTPKINKGDWVTISKSYAKYHGVNNLLNKYKILSKTVRAKDLYTDGNDLNEWGYDPE